MTTKNITPQVTEIESIVPAAHNEHPEQPTAAACSVLIIGRDYFPPN